MRNIGIDDELKLFEQEQGSLRGYAMESVALYAILNAHDIPENKNDRVLSLLHEVGQRVVAEGYAKKTYETAIDEEIERHDTNSLIKYGFTSKEVVGAMGDVWAEENEME